MKAVARASSLLLAALAVGLAFANGAPAGQLVLVTDRTSALAPLTPQEVRQAFLGIPVYQQDRRIRPVLNVSDRRLYEVFLQKAMYLSATNYERQVVRRVFQYGGARPPAVEDAGDVVAMVAAGGNQVAFMWAADALQHPELKVVQVLWRGDDS